MPARIREFGDLTITGTSFRTGERLHGWRVSAVNEATQQSSEYWVRDGQVFHVQIAPPARNHRSPFVIGRPVKRMEPSTRAAILDAVKSWSSPEKDVSLTIDQQAGTLERETYSLPPADEHPSSHQQPSSHEQLPSHEESPRPLHREDGIVKANSNPDYQPHGAFVMAKNQVEGHWVATCKICGGVAALSTQQAQIGTPTCFGSRAVFAWNPLLARPDTAGRSAQG